MTRAREIEKAVKDYDRELFVMQMPDGRIDIYRQNRDKLSPAHYTLSLTDNWNPQGQKRDWGIEPVLNRLRAMDLWRDDKFVERYIQEHERETESQERDRRNSMESFLYEFRSQFHKTFNDVNTSLMDKKASHRG